MIKQCNHFHTSFPFKILKSIKRAEKRGTEVLKLYRYFNMVLHITCMDRVLKIPCVVLGIPWSFVIYQIILLCTEFAGSHRGEVLHFVSKLLPSWDDCEWVTIWSMGKFFKRCICRKRHRQQKINNLVKHFDFSKKVKFENSQLIVKINVKIIAHLILYLYNLFHSQFYP